MIRAEPHAVASLKSDGGPEVINTINYFRRIIGIGELEYDNPLSEMASSFGWRGVEDASGYGVAYARGQSSLLNGIKAMLNERRRVSSAGGVCGNLVCNGWRTVMNEKGTKIGCALAPENGGVICITNAETPSGEIPVY